MSIVGINYFQQEIVGVSLVGAVVLIVFGRLFFLKNARSSNMWV